MSWVRFPSPAPIQTVHLSDRTTRRKGLMPLRQDQAARHQHCQALSCSSPYLGDGAALHRVRCRSIQPTKAGYFPLRARLKFGPADRVTTVTCRVTTVTLRVTTVTCRVATTCRLRVVTSFFVPVVASFLVGRPPPRV